MKCDLCFSVVLILILSCSSGTYNDGCITNQRRPFLVYWGNVQNPKYLQVRFLHDDYDFSSAGFYSAQKENRVPAAINFVTNGGDKHISIDRIKGGKFSVTVPVKPMP